MDKLPLQYGSRPVYETDDIFIISDVTGDNTKLEQLLKKLPLKPTSMIVFVGDLVGAGGSSLDVLQTVSHLKKTRSNVIVIKGNHDQAFIEQLAGNRSMTKEMSLDWEFLEQFLYLGFPNLAPGPIMAFLKRINVLHVLEDMIPYFETKDLIVTHAGLSQFLWRHHRFDRWNVKIGEFTSREYPLDILGPELRWAFVDEDANLGKMKKFLICGHQTKNFQYPKPRLTDRRCFLDCGVGYRSDRDLFAIHFPSKELFSST